MTRQGSHRRAALLACWAACTLVASAGCDRTASPPVAGASAQAPGAVAPADEPPPPDDDRLTDKTFDDIKFDIEPDAPFDRSMLTDAVRDLDGRRVRLRGYILPTAQKRGIKEFVLVRDNQECCFGPGAALYDCVLVSMLEGQSTEFSVRPVAVEGRFSVEEFYGPDDRPLAIYRLEGEAVE